MTRWRALAAIWIGAAAAWWLLVPIIVMIVVGASEWIESGSPYVDFRDYVNIITLSDGIDDEGAWVLIAVAVFAATLQLMLVAPAVPPYRAAEQGRPMTQSIVAAAIVAGALVTALAFGAVEALIVLIRMDVLDAPSNDPAWLASGLAVTWLLTSAAWTAILWRAGSVASPDRVSRLVRSALQGSALQVVLALPLYVIVRRKESCWCSLLTFWSLCIGLASMLLLCGPGLVLLLTRSHRRLWRQGACTSCGHVRSPGSNRCPECGAEYAARPA